ncbi:MAG: CheR family methyltransferase [Planctomycetota bacterium]|jgi:chemotaxis protein methyltransferase CheR
MSKPISDNEIDLLTHAISTLTGIHLDRDKAYLLENRFTALMKRHGFADYLTLYHHLNLPESHSLREEITNAITTGETSFFRDRHPFDLLAQHLLPSRLQAASSQKRLRIWCVGCSTGQEVYSIAMKVYDACGALAHVPVEILGTDISTQALDRAVRGEYSSLEVERGIPCGLEHRYFNRVEEQWRVRDELRQICRFEHCNLLDSLYQFGMHDIIFCRNVTIYFAADTRQRVIRSLASCLSKEGVLVVGATETLSDLKELFEPHHCGEATYFTKR